jgi:hypothetical protein
MARNESFAANMVGKVVSFDVQPYEFGTGEIVAVREREVTVTQFMAPYGRTTLTYDTFDIDVKVSEGRKVGALYGGVAVQSTVKDTAGSVATISGVSYFDLHDAAIKGKRIIQARCG